jgi:hypothetical protein
MIFSGFSLVLAVSFAYLSGGSLSLRPLFDLKTLEPVFSQSLCCQLLIGQSFVKGRENKAIKAVERVIFDVSEIEPERKFSNVAVKMFRANVMINARNAAFQQSPDGFNAVRINAVASVFAARVIDGLMLKEKPVKVAVSTVFVGKDRRADRNVIMDSLLNDRQTRVLNVHRFSSPTAFTHTENGLLTDRTATAIEFQISVFVGFFATDIGFVYLDNTSQFVDVRAASLSEPLEHKPRRLLRNAYLFTQLERRNALSSSDKQIHRIDPFVKRNVRTLKDRASANREIQFTGVTAIVTAFPSRDAFTDLTSRTDHAVRPQARFEINASGFLIWDSLEQLKSGYGAFAHVLNIPKRSKGVKYIIPNMKGQSDARSIDDPTFTQTKKQHQCLAEPYIIKFYGNGEGSDDINDPLATVTAKDRFALCIPSIGIALDIRFRMLQPHELAAAMSFPKNYEFTGNREQKVKQIGNAVPLETAKALCKCLLGN